jgi:hypothetical protein
VRAYVDRWIDSEKNAVSPREGRYGWVIKDARLGGERKRVLGGPEGSVDKEYIT